MNDWNDDWRDELKKDNYEMWLRLADCKNTKKDMRVISKLMYKYNPHKTKEECVDRTILWITDWNNQFTLVPDDEEFKQWIESL